MFKILVKIEDHASKIEFYRPKVRLSPITRASFHDLSFLEIHLFTSRHVHSISPPEFIINILDYVHLDDLLVSARLVNRMWNVEPMARANDSLTDWPDAVPYLSPVELECLFPGNRLKKTEFDGKDPQCRASHARWNTGQTILGVTPFRL